MEMQTPTTFADFGAVPNTGSGIISVPEERCANCGFGIHNPHPDVGCANCGYVPRRRHKYQKNSAEAPASISMSMPYTAPPAAMPAALLAPRLAPVGGHYTRPYVYGTRIFSHGTALVSVEAAEGISDFSAGEMHGHSIGSAAAN